MKRWLLWGIAFFLFLGLFLPGLSRGSLWAQVVSMLPWGWTAYLHRTLPEVTINWSGLWMVAVCSGGIVWGLHWFGSWWAGQRGGGQWPWRRTWALFGGVWLLFVMVMAVAGVVGHVTWLARADVPVMVVRANPAADMFMLEGAVRLACLEADGDPAKRRQLLREAAMGRYSGRGPFWEHYETIFLSGADEHTPRFLVLPRDGAARRKWGFLLSTETGRERRPFHELHPLLGL